VSTISPTITSMATSRPIAFSSSARSVATTAV
jgi:hypothetical protein